MKIIINVDLILKKDKLILKNRINKSKQYVTIFFSSFNESMINIK